MKTYTNSKGESLPKVICAVVEFEIQKQNIQNTSIGQLFKWHESEIFGKYKNVNKDSWARIFKGDYDCFYSIFPTCKNSRGQELPEEIQVEIVEERLRQGHHEDKQVYLLGFNYVRSLKGPSYWIKVYETDYTPTKSDDTFTQWEIVEVSDREDFSKKYTGEIYLCFFNGLHWTISKEANKVAHSWKYCRKPTLELTLPELLTIAEEVKRTKVKLKS